jgi:hypothetical protein
MLAVKKKPRGNRAIPLDPERRRGRLLRAAFMEMHRSKFRSADLDAILAALFLGLVKPSRRRKPWPIWVIFCAGGQATAARSYRCDPKLQKK